MEKLEDVTERLHKAYFVDLFVRQGNTAAIQMYEKVEPVLLCVSCSGLAEADSCAHARWGTSSTDGFWATTQAARTRSTCARRPSTIRRSAPWCPSSTPYSQRCACCLLDDAWSSTTQALSGCVRLQDLEHD